MVQDKQWDYSKYPGAKTYPHLFKPIKIGKLTVPNRIKYAATEDNLNQRDGYVTDADVAYIRERAKGVVGGICTIQGVYMDEKMEGKGYVGQAAAWDDKFIPGLKRLSDAIQEEGALSNIQLMHCGRVGGVDIGYCVGPSLVQQRLRVFEPVREMSKDDIKQCIKEHAEAARRGVEAGYDIMEISGIVGYLVSNFLSGYTNRRTDEYGGDIEGRCTFMVETIHAVRDVIGDDMPLIIRLCAEELLDDVGGNTPEESMVTYKKAEEAGVDCMSVTQGWQESIIPVISRDIPQGSWLYNAERAKKALKIPVSMAYRLFTPDLPNKAIGEGKLDIWEMCRSQIADPHMPLKVLEGREEDIRHCVACNMCLARLFRNAPMTCFINPVCAHDHDERWQIKPTDDEKEVMIVGAGPSGLECAWVAAKRGHKVTVYDSSGEIGGNIRYASKGPYGDEELMKPINFHKAQCDKNGVTFKLGTTVTKELLEEVDPDTVVIATGSKFTMPDAPGHDKPHVFSVQEFLDGKAKIGNNIVVWGSRKPAITAALMLGKQKKKVALVCGDRKVGKDVNPSFIWRYIMKLSEYRVRTYNNSTIEEISDNGVVVRLLHDVRVPVKADTIIYADREPVRELEQVAKDLGIEVYVLGDALVPRNLSHAVHDGYRIGVRM
jgi:2,4-dienoyl-CoA reductase (NADPH2)